jgi:hypothetical protein
MGWQTQKWIEILSSYLHISSAIDAVTNTLFDSVDLLVRIPTAAEIIIKLVQ